MSSVGTEYRGFVFSLIFLLVFGALIASMPTAFYGVGEDPEDITGIDPNLVSGFSESTNWTSGDYVEQTPLYPNYWWYEYELGVNDFVTESYNNVTLRLFAKILWLGTFWFGQYDNCIFSLSGSSRGTDLTFTEVQADHNEGVVSYSTMFETAGVSAGSFIIDWNYTLYPSFTHAWGNDSVRLIHGIGFAESATADVGALIVGFLFLQVPEIPTLVNIILVTPVWASIIYLLWFIIKEMIPFVG